MPKHQEQSDFEVFTPLPFLALTRAPGNPHTGFGSPSECHQYNTASFVLLSAQAPEQKLSTCSFRGFFPCSVLPVTGSHITRRVPPHPVRLRPQGFSPSRRFAPPMTCQACSILVPLMGLTLQGFAPLPVPYVLSNAASLLELAEYLTTQVLLQGFAHQAGSRALVWGLVRNQRQMPPWAFPPLRFLAHGSGRKRNRNRPSPLTLFAIGRKLTNYLASQGCHHHERIPSLSRRT
jgi:hypothetical protein